VVRAIKRACASDRPLEGHIAQYLGDGLLVYLATLWAHEETPSEPYGLTGNGRGPGQLNTAWAGAGVHLPCVWGPYRAGGGGDVGGGTRQEPWRWARRPTGPACKGSRRPYLVISAATCQLLGGSLPCQSLGTPPLKALPSRWRSISAVCAHGRSRWSGGQHWPDPLVVGSKKWGCAGALVQVKDGVGQVVLLAASGHWQIAPGAGLRNTWHRLRCADAVPVSPYYRNQALYPLIDRAERWRCASTGGFPQQKRSNRGLLVQYGSTTGRGRAPLTSFLFCS